MNFSKILDPDALLRMTFCCIVFSTFAKQSLDFKIFFQQFEDRFIHELNHNDKASGFITLLLLKTISPHFFKKQKLQNKLENVLCQMELVTATDKLLYHDLQGYLDYLYFLKLFHKKQQKLQDHYFKMIFDVAKIKKLSPEQALLTWIYFEIICFCNLISSYKKEKEQKKLESVILKNKEM
jgi:predicted nucleic acid binding AN1-type Zn finger protein